MTDIEKIVETFFSSEEIIRYYSNTKLNSIELNLMKRYFKKNGKIYDVCCGAGRVAFELADLGFNVVGSDSNKLMIAAGNKRIDRENNSKIRFFHKDAANFIFKKNFFDGGILAEFSLECVPNSEKRIRIIKNIYLSLKKKGFLITNFHSPFYPPKLFLKTILAPKGEIGSILYRIKANGQLFHLRKPKILFFHFFFPWEITIFKKVGFIIKEIVPYDVSKPSKNLASSNFSKKFPQLFDCIYVFQKK